MNEETFVNVSDPAVSSTLNKKKRTAISKFGKAMASFSSVYDLNFRSLVEKNQLGVGEDLSGRV